MQTRYTTSDMEDTMALKGFLPILAAAMALVTITASAQHDNNRPGLAKEPREQGPD